jgi:GNAT superfamily N-acetyltransferase
MASSPAEHPIDVPLSEGPESPRMWPIRAGAAIRVHGSFTSKRGAPRAVLVSLGPLEGAARLDGEPSGFDTGVILTVVAPLTAGRTTSFRVQIVSRTPDGAFTFRILGGRSSERAALVMLVWCPGFSLQQARLLGIRVRGVDALLEARVVETEAMLTQAREVRRRGNQTYLGALNSVRDTSLLADNLDPYSVIIVCTLGDKAVGTGRVVINGGDRSRSECERERPAGIPPWLWEGGFVEASRFAVCPEYRTSGIMTKLLREVGRISLRTRARYIVLECIDKLIPMYQRVGAESLDLARAHPYGKDRLTLMYVDLQKSLTRIGNVLGSWLFVFAPVVDWARREGELRYLEEGMKLRDRAVCGLKKVLSAIATAALRVARR